MKAKHRRLVVLGVCALGLGGAAALTLTALRSDIVFYLSPSQIASRHPGTVQTFRLGGLVEAGSLRHFDSGGEPRVTFRVTDLKGDVEVSYTGILPDLFREGQGVVTLGHLTTAHTFEASEVLAKHDETYMPKDVEEALKASGEWRPELGPAPAAASWNMLDPKRLAQPKPGA